MKTTTLLALALVLAAPAVPAVPEHGVEAILYDLFLPLPFGALNLTAGCGGGQFASDASTGWFEYDERLPQAASGTPELAPSGYFDTGCGTATALLALPPGTDHVHARFEADRGVQEMSLSAPGVHFTQQLRVGTGGDAIAVFDYFPANGTAQPMTAFDPPAFDVPAGATELILQWYFEDSGFATSQDLPSVLSGEDYRGRVQNVTIELSGADVEGAAVGESVRRSGTFRHTDVRVEAVVPEALLAQYAVDLRVRASTSLEFRRVIAPDGTVMEDAVTRTSPGPGGFDRQHVLWERPDSEVLQITVPGSLLAAHGPGEYAIVLGTLGSVHAEPALVPLAVFLLALPLPFGALAMHRIRGFEKEAFGGFRRSARNLRFALFATGLYYVLVVASAFVGGRIDLMASLPIRAEAVLLYVQVLVAIAAFVTLYLVARELHLITRPRAPREADAAR